MAKDYGFKATPVDENKPISEYTKKEARLMFEWYLDDLPKRIQYLFDYINESVDIPIEYTFETFKNVISWLSTNIKIEFKSSKEIAEEKKKVPEIAWESIADWKFTEESVLIIMAVAGYLGMTMINELKNSHWELDTYKKSRDYNRAVIITQTGNQLSPINIVDMLAHKIIQHKEYNI